MAFQRFDWPDAATLAKELAARIATKLARHVAADGEAFLAVSGGQTPVRMLEALSAADLHWSKVTITLVDERWVGEESPRSNAALVRRHLLQRKAAAARFLPLYAPDHTPEAGCVAAELQLRTAPKRLTVAVLGMGEDGHTASFFPGGDRLEAVLDPGAQRLTGLIRAPGAGEPRITLTLAMLLSAGSLALHIEGEAKRCVLEKALGKGSIAEMPVRAILRQGAVPVEIHWAP